MDDIISEEEDKNSTTTTTTCTAEQQSAAAEAKEKEDHENMNVLTPRNAVKFMEQIKGTIEYEENQAEMAKSLYDIYSHDQVCFFPPWVPALIRLAWNLFSSFNAFSLSLICPIINQSLSSLLLFQSVSLHLTILRPFFLLLLLLHLLDRPPISMPSLPKRSPIWRPS